MNKAVAHIIGIPWFSASWEGEAKRCQLYALFKNIGLLLYGWQGREWNGCWCSGEKKNGNNCRRSNYTVSSRSYWSFVWNPPWAKRNDVNSPLLQIHCMWQTPLTIKVFPWNLASLNPPARVAREWKVLTWNKPVALNRPTAKWFEIREWTSLKSLIIALRSIFEDAAYRRPKHGTTVCQSALKSGRGSGRTRL